MGPQWHDDIENTQWIEFLHRFIPAKDLHLFEELAPLIALALRESVGSTDVSPALLKLFFEGLEPSRLFPGSHSHWVLHSHARVLQTPCGRPPFEREGMGLAS